MDAEQLNVADGVEEAVGELVFSEVLGAHLDSTQNNCKLLTKVTRVAKAALVDLVETMEEFHALTTDAFVEIIAEAWTEQSDKPLPPLMVARIRQWREGGTPAAVEVLPRADDTDAALRNALGAGGNGVAGVGTQAQPALLDATDGMALMGMGQQGTMGEAGEYAGMLVGLGPSMTIVAQKDCVSQGLPVPLIIAFSASLEKGKVVEIHEILGEKYATDPRGYAMIRQCCKYDEHTGSKLLARGEEGFSDLISMYLDLARDLVQTNKIVQSVLLSTWLSEGQSGFKGDQKAFVAYLRAYRRLYAGRGLPVMWDERMAVRARNETREAAGPSLSKQDVLALVKEGGSAQLTQLKREVAELKQRRPKKEGEVTESAETREKRLKNMKCFKCNKKGHIAADCPEAAAVAAAEE